MLKKSRLNSIIVIEKNVGDFAMRYENILLDADGTLLDFLAAEDAAVRETMSLYGIKPTDELVAAYSEINDGFWKMLERGEIKREELLYKRFQVFCERFGFSVDYMKMAADYRALLRQQGQLLDGAVNFLQKLYGKAKLYIVTNGVATTQSKRIEISGITKYIDEIFISENLGCEKPDVRYFEKVSEILGGLDKSRTVIVGDSLTSDIKGGIAFGIDTCWFTPKSKSAPADMNITCIAKSFDEIFEFLIGEN